MRIRKLRDDARLITAVGKIALRNSQLDYVLRLIIAGMRDEDIKTIMKETELKGSSKLRKIRMLGGQKEGQRLGHSQSTGWTSSTGM